MKLGGQTLPAPSLSIEFDNDIENVDIGGSYTVSGRIIHDVNSSNISAGTPINYSIIVTNKNGAEVSKTQFAPNTNGLSNGESIAFSSTFVMPWSEDDIWAGVNDQWRATVLVESPGANGDSKFDSFTVNIADLSLNILSPATARAGDYIDITGQIINNSPTAPSEAFKYFRIDATMPNVASINSTLFPPQSLVDSTITWPIQGSSTLDFTIPNVYIPADQQPGDLSITIFADAGNHIKESVETVESNQAVHTINIVSGTANIDAFIQSEITGTFQGLDPVNLRVNIINSGDYQVLNSDTFNLTIALSQDIIFSNDDFVLREINIAGGTNPVGLGLLPNETITFDWVQLLPDNFEGDYYLLVSNNSSANALYSTSTPVISLRSENSVNTNQISGSLSGASGRPSVSSNGNLVAFESLLSGVNQILLQNMESNEITQITNSLSGTVPNGSSFAPCISANGHYLAFHSMASDLVPDDTNDKSDVFLYNIYSKKLTKISNNTSGSGANGGSFYPTINAAGNFVAFESEATNLTSEQSVSYTRQIYRFEQNATTNKTTIIRVTGGNNDSFDASIDGNGSLVVFSSYATNLINNPVDNNTHADVFLWDNRGEIPKIFYAGLTHSGKLPQGGETKEPVISQDGNYIAFHSSASDMVSGKGLSHIQILDAGLGYTDRASVEVLDSNGSGASISLGNLVNSYGEITGFSIDTPGRGYVDPIISIVPDPQNSPTRIAKAKPLLVNLGGDIFRIKVSSILDNSGGSIRISESFPLNQVSGRTGGNKMSREPTISSDGSRIAYSSLASNLLDNVFTSTSQKVFPNSSFRNPMATAILHGGIGKIEILQSGSGYPANGNLLIEDLSGSGQGAIASFLSDPDGRIIHIKIQDSGKNYNLSKTIVSVQNAIGGSGFVAGDFKFEPITTTGGGATISRIEMLDSGIGYSFPNQTSENKPSFIIDGDGVDRDGDGLPDTRINPDRIIIGQNGELYLEQNIEIEIINPSALLGSSLRLADKNREVTIQFSEFPSPPLQVSVNQTSKEIKDSIIECISQQWANPSSISSGPQIEITDDNTFVFKALTGRVTSETPSALRATILSNMLIQGTGFTRATIQVTPAPTIYGLSEVTSVPNIATSSNGRMQSQFQEDFITDDIYIFDEAQSKNYRANINKFGFPTSYLTSSNMPSSRFPTLSGDGRYIFYSSDAEGMGGLIFGNSNQDPQDNNQNRDIFYRDLKLFEIPQSIKPQFQIDISSQLLDEVKNEVILNSNFPVYVNASISHGSIESLNLYVNNEQATSISNSIPGSREINQNISWENNGLLGLHIVRASIIDDLGNEYFSKPIEINVVKSVSSIISGELLIEPSETTRTIFIMNPQFQIITNPVTGITTNQFIDYEVTGPHTELEVTDMVNNSEIFNLFIARGYYSGQSAADSKSFFEVYPFRTLVSSGSTISARALFLGENGQESNLKKVSFFLNGQKLGVDQTEAPYFINFSPPSRNLINQNSINTWDLTAVALDLNDKYYILSSYGNVEFAQEFPDLTIDVVSSLSGVSQNELLDGQVVTIRGTMSGSSEDLKKVKSVHFLVNGFPFARVDGNPIISSTGTFKYIDYETPLEVEFDKYAKPSGTISVYALFEMEGINGHIPLNISNVLNLEITEPIPWVNETSSLLSLYADMTGNAPNSEEISFAIEKANQTDIPSWINSMTESGVLSDRVDMVAAHKVIYGVWYSEYKKFISDTSLWASTSGSSPEWLKSYIDFELSSGVYKFRYGIVPYLVGDYSSSRIVNFTMNRYDFIKRCFKNKYSTEASLQQLVQGSFKMLQYWATYESDYWEFMRTNNVTQVDSPARRDSVAAGSAAPTWDPTVPYPPSFVVSLSRSEYRSSVAVGAPAGAVPTTHPNWTYLRTLGFENGEVAVDFVYSMAKEITEKGTPYLLSTDPYQNTYFKLATLMHSIWQGNADPLTDADITPLISLSTTDAIRKILADHRYTKRFNLMWESSETLGVEFPNWKSENWFGYFMDQYFPWVFHEDLGWIYIAGVSQSRFWFYSERLGWLWTGSSYFNDNKDNFGNNLGNLVYSNNESNWVRFYKKGSTVTNSNTGKTLKLDKSYLYLYNTGTWEPF